jgi:hypothetical protein
MSIRNSDELVRDRIKFKFHCAEQHLNNLVNFQQTETINTTSESRVRWEAETECLLNQLMGARDALLGRINEKLCLRISSNRVELGTINQALNLMKRGDLLDDLNKLACSDGSWFWNLNELRNIGTHRSILNIRVDMEYEPHRITLIIKPDRVTDTEVIPYLADSIQRMKDLIESIIIKDPILRDPLL